MNNRNERGQFVIEAVLLMVLSMGLLLTFIKICRQNDVLAKLVETPWEKTAGMIESGVWAPAEEAKKKLPYQYVRFYTPNTSLQNQ